MMTDNPKQYRTFCQPKTRQAADEACEAFAAGVVALREKHGIPDVVLVASIVAEGEQGDDERHLSLTLLGDRDCHAAVVAQIFGTLQEVQRQRLSRQVSKGRRLANK